MKSYSEFCCIEDWEYAYIHNRKELVSFCNDRGITMEELVARIIRAKLGFLKFLDSLINESGEDE